MQPTKVNYTHLPFQINALHEKQFLLKCFSPMAQLLNLKFLLITRLLLSI